MRKIIFGFWMAMAVACFGLGLGNNGLQTPVNPIGNGAGLTNVNTTTNQWFVEPDGKDSNNGKNWGPSNAFLTLTNALSNAFALGGNNIVFLPQGTFPSHEATFIPTNTTIVGFGQGITFIQLPNTNGEGLIITNGDILKNFTINFPIASYNTGTETAQVSSRGSTNFLVDGLEFNGDSDGLYFMSGYAFGTVQNCYFHTFFDCAYPNLGNVTFLNDRFFINQSNTYELGGPQVHGINTGGAILTVVNSTFNITNNGGGSSDGINCISAYVANCSFAFDVNAIANGAGQIETGSGIVVLNGLFDPAFLLNDGGSTFIYPNQISNTNTASKFVGDGSAITYPVHAAIIGASTGVTNNSGRPGTLVVYGTAVTYTNFDTAHNWVQTNVTVSTTAPETWPVSPGSGCHADVGTLTCRIIFQ